MIEVRVFQKGDRFYVITSGVHAIPQEDFATPREALAEAAKVFQRELIAYERTGNSIGLNWSA